MNQVDAPVIDFDLLDDLPALAVGEGVTGIETEPWIEFTDGIPQLARRGTGARWRSSPAVFLDQNRQR